MAGAKGRSGRKKHLIYGKRHWIGLVPRHADLLQFFQQLDQLPPDQANEALLAAIRGGAAAGQAAIEQSESHKTSAALDVLLDEL